MLQFSFMQPPATTMLCYHSYIYIICLDWWYYLSNKGMIDSLENLPLLSIVRLDWTRIKCIYSPHLWLLSPFQHLFACLSHSGTKPRFMLVIFNPRTAGLRIVALNKPARGIYPEPDLSHISLTPPHWNPTCRPAEPWHTPHGYLAKAKPHGE